MNIAVIIILMVIVMMFIIAMIALFYKLRKLITPGVPPNSPLVFSLDPLRSQGFAFGVQKEVKGSTRSALLLSIKPLDLPYDSKGRAIAKEDVDVAVRHEKKIELPVGALSLHRSCIILLPESASNLNSELRNTEFGMAISGLIELKNYKDKAIDIIANRQAGERSYVALLEEAQNELMSFYKGVITEITAHAKENAMATRGGIR